MKNYEPLITLALENQKHAYAPYSRFHVSAALLCDSGKIYTGVNVENASYPAGICAERNAVSHAVNEGERRAGPGTPFAADHRIRIVVPSQ